MALTSKYQQMITSASQGCVQGEVEFQKVSAPPFVLAAQSRFNRKMSFWKINPVVVAAFAPICSTVRQKGSMTAPF
jgi:hypothetical protein